MVLIAEVHVRKRTMNPKKATKKKPETERSKRDETCTIASQVLSSVSKRCCPR